MDKDWTPPTLHVLEWFSNGQGLDAPPNLHDLERFPNGQGLDPPVGCAEATTWVPRRL